MDPTSGDGPYIKILCEIRFVEPTLLEVEKCETCLELSTCVLLKLLSKVLLMLDFSPAAMSIYMIWLQMLPLKYRHFPAKIYLFSRRSNRITRKRCKTCSKLTIKAPERPQWRRSAVFIVNFEHISDIFLVFIVLYEQVNVSWVITDNYVLL